MQRPAHLPLFLAAAALATVSAPAVHAAAPAQATASAAAPQRAITRTFVFVADAETVKGAAVKSVSLAGTFNNWDKNAHPLTADPDGRTWRVSLPLGYGQHQYKFVVNGETWIPDPRAEKNADDGGGNINSFLTVLPPDYAAPARPDDGVTALSALEHATRAPLLNYDRNRLSLSLRVRPGDASAVSVIANGKRYPMAVASRDDLYARYSVSLPWDRKKDLAYAFELTDGPKTVRYGVNGVADGATAAAPFTLTAAAFKPYRVPTWVEKTVFYQIFPDRFANGSKANDPADAQAWDAKPSWFNRYGGDIAGVRRHIDHLSGLGVSSVYFNPVFKSPSNHRYDAEDFKAIDPQFGTNAEFAALTRELDKRGIRTVMDFVFNHSATTFAPFADIREKGAASAYKDWYFVKSYPVAVKENPNYEAWYGYPSMPKMNVLNPETRDYLLGLVDYWKKTVPLAGLRLDVANEVDPRFWRELRNRVKGLDPEMWIVGEVWGDGTPWLGGDQWDSVMNYQFRDACLRYIAEGKTTPTQFVNRLMGVHNSYAPQVSRNMMNLLSSHDTPRFLTLCGEDAALHRLGATVQFTWVGAPSVYYGEEIGMSGGADPDNRRGMEWAKATPDNPMLRFYKRLIAVRNASPALQSGDPVILLNDDAANTVAYARTLENDVALVALNRSAEARTVEIPLADSAALAAARKTGLIEAVSGRRIPLGAGKTLRVSLPPKGAAVLLPARGAALKIKAAPVTE